MQKPLTSHLDLFGSPECDYHAKVTIGSNTMNLVLDTGSSNTAVVSDLCQQCSFVQKPYLPLDNLNPSNAVNVTYGNNKLQSAWQGFSTDQWVTLDDINTSNLVRIDAITENQSFFIPRCSENQGIWGLAYPSLQTQPLNKKQSTKNKTTLFDSLRQEKGIPNAFTIQICSKSLVDTGFGQEFNFLRQVVSERNHTQKMMVENECNSSSRRQGHLWLGGYPSQSVGSEIVWVRLVHQRYYQVHIDRFLVNNQDVGMEKLNLPSRTIVDTGTKDIVLSTENLQKLLNALWKAKLVQFDASVSKDHERSFWFDHAQLTLPRSSITISHNLSLKIAFDDETAGQHKQVSIPIENILNIKPYEAMKGWVNISWTGFSPSDHPMASIILGNTLLRGKTVIFDRDSRIGFTDAPPSCCQPSSGHDVNILLSLDDRQIQTLQKSLSHPNTYFSTIIPHLLLALFVITYFQI